jgi:uncharacterized protein (DUF1501 family)
MLTRRDFLRGSALLALAPTVPGFLARTARAARPEPDGRILVVLQLDGGNDGLNTVVPHADEAYAQSRPRLRLPAKQLLKVNEQVGLHPALADAGKLLERGQLAIVPGVGYPNPSRSHFQSMAVWHTARLDPEEHKGFGWLGRGLDAGERPANGTADAVFVGSGSFPVALRARRAVASALTRPEDFVLAPEAHAQPSSAGAAGEDLAAFVRRSTLDAYATADRLAQLAREEDRGTRYPATELARQLRLIARLIKTNAGTRVFYATQPGYDTHSAQLGAHAALLDELGGALRAFFEDLTAAKLAERVLLLTFSEFGRQLKENASQGTDHGTVGPVFLAGPGVRAGWSARCQASSTSKAVSRR